MKSLPDLGQTVLRSCHWTNSDDFGSDFSKCCSDASLFWLHGVDRMGFKIDTRSHVPTKAKPRAIDEIRSENSSLSLCLLGTDKLASILLCWKHESRIEARSDSAENSHKHS
jgi:hypothetical protein